MKISIIEILNANVYLTNIITLPVIVMTFLIAYNIRHWNSKETQTEFGFTRRQWYEFLWGLYFIIVVIGFIMSNIYHLNMFTDNTFWKWVGSMDEKVSAPLLACIMALLCVLYFIYLTHTSSKQTKQELILKKETIPLYVIGIFFICVGVISYLVKRRFYYMQYYAMNSEIKSMRDYAIWTSAHIFFHYMSYTGGLLIVMLYFIQNKNIYRTLNQLLNSPSNTKD